MFQYPNPKATFIEIGVYLSLPSYVLTSRKSAKWTSRFELELSIDVMVLYKSPISPQDRRERALQAAILTGSSFLNYLKGGGRFGNPVARPLGTFETNYKMAAREVKMTTRSRRSYGKKGPVNSLSMS